MADVTLIIGNGFDLDLGLKSSYKNFAASKEWKDLMHRYESFLMNETEQKKSLLWQINSASTASQWFDIEEEIHKFVQEHPTLSQQEIEEIQYEFEGIKKALCEYLRRCVEEFEFKPDNKRLSSELLYLLYDNPCNVIEFNFNYTDVHDFLGDSNIVFPTHIHGCLKDKDIVLGCDIQEGEKVNRNLSFLYKYNMLKKANHMVRSMLDTNEVIIFGHSINEMDFCYFREYLKVASSSSQQMRYLTIFTYDEQSERTIKDNMRNQGISVSDLYNNLEEFTFIHTKNFYEGDTNEYEKLGELDYRLKKNLSW